jgi:hypothetical protein
LKRRVALNLSVSDFRCDGCGGRFAQGPWIGPKAPVAMQVRWQDLVASPWRWVTTATRGMDA